MNFIDSNNSARSYWMSTKRSAGLDPLERILRQRKKTAKIVPQEAAREIDRIFRFISKDRGGTAKRDLVAVEMLVRCSMHKVGAAVLIHLLISRVPTADDRGLTCKCGGQASYKDLRSKILLTILGKVSVTRPYYLCAHCHQGHCTATWNWTLKTPGSHRVCAGCRR